MADKKSFALMLIGLVILLTIPIAGAASDSGEEIIDNNTYIDANKILMFLTNRSLFGRDLDGVFGHDYGTYYPFYTVQDIQNGTQIKSPLYSGGLWIGGKVDSETRVAIADFATEYWPGPMEWESYIPHADTMSAYRVYKLYSDSGGRESEY